MKVNVQDFCQNFYDSQVFYPIIMGQDTKWSYIDATYDSIVQIDKLFSSVDRSVFRKEMMAVRMEMVGLAFTHNVKNKEQLYEQSSFTQDYLNKNTQSEIWDIMGEYNQSIVMSCTDIAKRDKAVKEYAKQFGIVRMNFPCMARLCNRAGCEVAWDKQVTLRYLTARFADRVGCNESIHPDALMAITSVIWGFYQGAKEAIKSVKFE